MLRPLTWFWCTYLTTCSRGPRDQQLSVLKVFFYHFVLPTYEYLYPISRRRIIILRIKHWPRHFQDGKNLPAHERAFHTALSSMSALFTGSTQHKPSRQEAAAIDQEELRRRQGGLIGEFQRSSDSPTDNLRRKSIGLRRRRPPQSSATCLRVTFYISTNYLLIGLL